jgi:U4/U6 small nuclear ribonucleoprotein PRP31
MFTNNLSFIKHNPEYLLIIDVNNLLLEIDNEIGIIYNFVKMIYRKRFSELEQLVQLPMDYFKTVKICFLIGLKLS